MVCSYPVHSYFLIRVYLCFYSIAMVTLPPVVPPPVPTVVSPPIPTVVPPPAPSLPQGISTEETPSSPPESKLKKNCVILHERLIHSQYLYPISNILFVPKRNNIDIYK